ncbi:hypothetical protein RGR602_PC01748 (plasmid) [Rhizobium gallicum bv. gallicum R602sp]|uniref:Uncharacterized protein n=1 Tax=Rhizobium gallicum bv. gallicum R602sp TaxID=1041138 RepID=A0A0B4XH47_9HYPH|nr:hypothetical protein RGR602_PC01748 [Rhizobium gallicum bv. gallicum R602sp]
MQAWAEAGNLVEERERDALAWAETVTRAVAPKRGPTMTIAMAFLVPLKKAVIALPSR